MTAAKWMHASGGHGLHQHVNCSAISDVEGPDTVSRATSSCDQFRVRKRCIKRR